MPETGFMRISVDGATTHLDIKISNKFVKRTVCYFLTVLTSLCGLVGINTSLTHRNHSQQETEVSK
jgi:hypothetical protein